MKLSEQLKQWRAERPDEWKMDEFIRCAEREERITEELEGVIEKRGQHIEDLERQLGEWV